LSRFGGLCWFDLMFWQYLVVCGFFCLVFGVFVGLSFVGSIDFVFLLFVLYNTVFVISIIQFWNLGL